MNLTLSREGVYRWIVFLPSRRDGIGALNRYYGLMETGELKTRGIFLRRHDTPPLVKDMQKEMLNVLCEAENAGSFLERVPRALEVARRYASLVKSGSAPPQSLVISRRVAKGMDDYSVLTDTAAALDVLNREGFQAEPGQKVQFVLTDAKSKIPWKRVALKEQVESSTEYDVRAYLEWVARGAENLLSPWADVDKIRRQIAR